MEEEKDEYFMRRCFSLARRAEGKTSPNPMVGAVIVRKGKIISEGFHRKAGSAHAEVVAINNASGSLKNAALYVNLEPCSTYGRTPPCVDKIIESGIKRVLIATRDPNPLHNGRGIDILRKAGIEVIEGILKEEAQELNRVFFKHIVQKIPYLSIKVAQSLDARLADKRGNSQWISSEDARNYSHSQIRSKVDAILVGINTIIKDNPHLTLRKPDGSLSKRQPRRIILDSRLRVPLNSYVVSEGEAATLIVTAKNFSQRRKFKLLQNRGLKILTLESKKGKINLKKLLQKLYKEGICHILVEGGSEVISSVIEEKLADEMYIFIRGIILGGNYLMYKGEGFSLSQAAHLENISIRKFKDSILIRGGLKYV